MNDTIENRLQHQLAVRALSLPEKRDRLDVVRARGRRRQLVTRAAVSLAAVAGVFGIAGIASTAVEPPSGSTFAVGSPDDQLDTEVDAAGAPQMEQSLEVDASVTPQSTTTPEGASAGTGDAAAAPDGDGTDDPEASASANNSASFGDGCLPAPNLPDVSVSDPGKTVVRVGNETELQSAVQALQPNTVLLIAPGTYELSRTLWISEDDVTIRGDSNRCDEIVLTGASMENAAAKDSVPHGVWTDRANLKVQNLTIRDVYFHPISIDGKADAPQIYNVQLLDAGEQFIKVNPIGYGNGVNDGVVNYTVIKYTNGSPTTDHGGGIGYTQGVDIHAGSGWTIKNSRFENLDTPDDADHRWGPAVLAWNGATDTTVEANIFINVNRAIAFGLDQSRSRDHAGGVIRNNMIVLQPGMFSSARAAASDGAIIVWNSPGTKVLHNSIATQSNTNKSIELRFNTEGAEVRNNLVDAPISRRDGQPFVSTDNVMVDGVSMYRNPVIGDLHLVGDAATLDRIVDGGTPLAEVGHDFDGTPRPAGGAADIGADEKSDATDGPEPNPKPEPEPNPGPEPGPTTSQPPATNPPVTQPPVTVAPTTPPTVSTPPKPEPSGDRPDRLVRKADLAYQGSFRVPRGAGDESTTLAWGGAGLGYNEANDSLFITGHSWRQLTAEISIPQLGRSSDPTSIPQGTFLQRPEDATDGKLPTIAEPRENEYGRIGGYLVDGDDLIVSGYHYYDAADTQVRSHLRTTTDLGASSNMTSLSDDVKARWLGGAMAMIPSAWRSAFGGDRYIGGLAGISIVGNSSVGPAAATFSRDSLAGRDPARLVLGYPLSNPLDGPETTSNLWNLTSESRGMVFPDGTASVLYVGTHGTGTYCYGTGSACGDPVRDAQGTHAYPYRYQIWAYDAADLAEVYRGGAAADSVRPYDVWELTLPYSPRQTEIGGATYDPATGRIFISQAFADGDHPVVHVYKLR